jgi:hypothetical protein
MTDANTAMAIILVRCFVKLNKGMKSVNRKRNIDSLAFSSRFVIVFGKS